MSPVASTYDAEAARGFAQARDPRGLEGAVIALHRRVDDVLRQSVQGHGVNVACAPGCALCCHLLVEVMPAEAFHLATWLRRTLGPAALDALQERLRHNVAVTAALGDREARKHANVPCALLGPDQRCSAYAARPAACRRCHSTELAACEEIHARPGDDALESPMHPAVAHNAAVIMAQAREAQSAEGLDAAPRDLNTALLAALGDGKPWRRWRDGKKAFA
jgi:hypothetical protein